MNRDTYARILVAIEAHLTMKASWLAFTFSGLPPQAFSADACSARPYENVRAHGLHSRIAITSTRPPVQTSMLMEDVRAMHPFTSTSTLTS